MDIMKQLKSELGGELSQMYELLMDAIDTKDKDGAKQVYGMILWHLANKQNEKLVSALDALMDEV